MQVGQQGGRFVEPRGQAGFTLIELLVAMSIISVLAGVAVFAVGNARDNATKNACMTERNAFTTAGNVAELDSGDIRSYLQPSGRFFQADGSTGFVVRPGSPLNSDCE